MAYKTSPEIIPASEALDPALQIGCIATLPYGSDVRASELGVVAPCLSAPSGWSIDASVEIKRRQPGATFRIIGETLYGDEAPNTAGLMLDRVRRTADQQGLGNHVIKLTTTESGKYANNTSLQMQALSESLGTSGDGVLAVALKYHIGKVATHARAYGLKDMAYVAAEDVLVATGGMSEDDPLYEIFCAGVESSERLLRVIAKLDPLGRLIFNPMTNRRGPRVVNVVPAPSGPIFINTTARARRAAVEHNL